MAAPTTADEALQQALYGPKSVTNSDGQTVVSRDVDDLIKARDALSNGSSQAHFGMRITQLVPPGAG